MEPLRARLGIGKLLTIWVYAWVMVRLAPPYWWARVSIDNLATTLTSASFCALAWKCYTIPADWNYGTILVRHTLGVVSRCLLAPDCILVAKDWFSVGIAFDCFTCLDCSIYFRSFGSIRLVLWSGLLSIISSQHRNWLYVTIKIVQVISLSKIIPPNYIIQVFIDSWIILNDLWVEQLSLDWF